MKTAGSRDPAVFVSSGDSLYLKLKDAPGAENREVVAGLVVDLDANGDVVGFDIDQASGKLDLSRIDTIALPTVSVGQ